MLWQSVEFFVGYSTKMSCAYRWLAEKKQKSVILCDILQNHDMCDDIEKKKKEHNGNFVGYSTKFRGLTRYKKPVVSWQNKSQAEMRKKQQKQKFSLHISTEIIRKSQLQQWTDIS